MKRKNLIILIVVCLILIFAIIDINISKGRDIIQQEFQYAVWARKLHNSKFCDKIYSNSFSYPLPPWSDNSVVYLQSKCYMQLAIILEDSSLCEKIQENKHRINPHSLIFILGKTPITKQKCISAVEEGEYSRYWYVEGNKTITCYNECAFLMDELGYTPEDWSQELLSYYWDHKNFRNQIELIQEVWLKFYHEVKDTKDFNLRMDDLPSFDKFSENDDKYLVPWKQEQEIINNYIIPLSVKNM